MVRVAQTNKQSRHKYEFHMRKSIYSAMSVTCHFVDLRDGRAVTRCTEKPILQSTLLIYVDEKNCDYPTKIYRNKHLTLALACVCVCALVIHKFRSFDGDCNHLCIRIHKRIPGFGPSISFLLVDTVLEVTISPILQMIASHFPVVCHRTAHTFSDIHFFIHLVQMLFPRFFFLSISSSFYVDNSNAMLVGYETSHRCFGAIFWLGEVIA